MLLNLLVRQRNVIFSKHRRTYYCTYYLLPSVSRIYRVCSRVTIISKKKNTKASGRKMCMQMTLDMTSTWIKSIDFVWQTFHEPEQPHAVQVLHFMCKNVSASVRRGPKRMTIERNSILSLRKYALLCTVVCAPRNRWTWSILQSHNEAESMIFLRNSFEFEFRVTEIQFSISSNSIKSIANSP